MPYSGYNARLHKDEMVLTRGEAAEYREQQRGGGGKSVTIQVNGPINISNGMDYQTFVGRLARDLANA